MCGEVLGEEVYDSRTTKNNQQEKKIQGLSPGEKASVRT